MRTIYTIGIAVIVSILLSLLITIGISPNDKVTILERAGIEQDKAITSLQSTDVNQAKSISDLVTNTNNSLKALTDSFNAQEKANLDIVTEKITKTSNELTTKINDNKISLNSDIQAVSASVTTNKNTTDARIAALEARIVVLENKVTTLQTQLDTLSNPATNLTASVTSWGNIVLLHTTNHLDTAIRIRVDNQSVVGVHGVKLFVSFAASDVTPTITSATLTGYGLTWTATSYSDGIVFTNTTLFNVNPRSYADMVLSLSVTYSTLSSYDIEFEPSVSIISYY